MSLRAASSEPGCFRSSEIDFLPAFTCNERRCHAVIGAIMAANSSATASRAARSLDLDAGDLRTQKAQQVRGIGGPP